ncbi:glutamate 5-kinase [Candidatus Nitrosacidococcus tergens]|uniref:Glutamate 5-kinase n=1 Tax=Candidatus Nitrosacidococcus tergens TaxID=553981 RepID=A0A7G1QBX8_9GAMM|nr:glutamate 5-kinase [Candidatus Nitrosacidococcus tergens]CAB1277521.1 Glutamate 5-kinase [Candidatus Nitrosacidococcus tergens]
MSDYRSRLATSRRWVIKVGSSLLTTESRKLNTSYIQILAYDIAKLQNLGYQIVLVSSGSIAAGMQRLNWHQRPSALHHLQAAAAVGQMELVQVYESYFQSYGQQAAQILLTYDDLINRNRYLNARSTLRTLLQLKIVPIINENDTIATEEIRGDNDTLSALVANLVEAEVLVILTDQAGLFTEDPRENTYAELISETAASNPNLDVMASAKTGTLGRGGMFTKLRAARQAERSGAITVIAAGKEKDVIPRITSGEKIGTLLWPNTGILTARKQWLAGQLQTKGKIQLDTGAVNVLCSSGKSLLPIGVIACNGHFTRGDLVSCVDMQNREIARGLINYSAEETNCILGYPSSHIEQILGYVNEQELIHRDNLVLL